MKLLALVLTIASISLAQYAPMNNAYVAALIRKGVPTVAIVQTIKTAPDADFLVNNYEARLLTDVGATGRDVDLIMEAMHQRMARGQGGVSNVPAAPSVAVSNAEYMRGPELVTPMQPPPERLTLRKPGPRIVLDDATPIKLRIARNLSSADAKTGDTVDFEVLEDVKVEDRIVIAKGATAIGSITNAEAKRRMGRGGKLDVMIEFVKLADGEKAALRGAKDLKGGGHTGGMTTGIVATSLIFWPAAPLFLLMQGKDITIPKGTEITAYTNGNMTLDGGRFQYEARPESAQ